MEENVISAWRELVSRLGKGCADAWAGVWIGRWLFLFAILHLGFTGVALGNRRTNIAQALAALALVPALYAACRVTKLCAPGGGRRWLLDSAKALAARAGRAARACGAYVARDKVLAAALALGLLFGMHGMNWGRVECWNPDQLAMRGLKKNGQPHDYLKPPLFTYLNHAIVLDPLSNLEGALVRLGIHARGIDEAKLLASRFLVDLFFLSTVALIYETAFLFFGIAAARFAALAMVTGAGFAILNHFLTCDPVLLLPMMAAFYFCTQIYLRGRLADYLLAGVCTGLAFNMKYNGLAVGIAIPFAHFLAPARGTWMRRVFAQPFILSLCAVAGGALATGPWMIYDFHRFRNDFLLN